MRIDAHNHFWKYDPIRDSWIDNSMELIRRDFLPEDFIPILKANEIDGTVAVQANQSKEETEFLISLSEQNDEIVGVVGWVDLQSPILEELLDHFSFFEKLVGFRHIVQGEPDEDFMQRKAFERGISLLGNKDFTYDILIFPNRLKSAIKMVDRFPNQKFVIDHLAKPYIKDGLIDQWKLDIKEIAKRKNVWCKVSGMITEADINSWKYEDFVSYLVAVVESFGMNRLMYGSDWPVCLLAATYQDTLGIVEQFFSSFSQSEQNAFFGENAKEFYKLKLI